MNGLPDAVVRRLKTAGAWPAFATERYTALEEIGRGGMGTVYLALDEELNREVAIKIPNAPYGAALERRLQVEARVLATLEHPGIVPIHDAGRLADGRLFYVMKRVRGRTLPKHVQDVTALTERLRVFERICEPVAFAHAQGFIHRDLKPENVMVGSFGEVMVMDWGVAKATSVDSRQSAVDEPLRPSDTPGRSIQPLTVSGVIVGTHGFMAPEQARGTAEAIDQRADVYGLGAILFFLLTRDTPAADVHAALTRHRVPRPLTAICARALTADPAGRYPTVAALAADVASYRAGRAVGAYEETIFERLRRVERTYRTAVVLVLAYIVMRAMVAFIAGW